MAEITAGKLFDGLARYREMPLSLLYPAHFSTVESPGVLPRLKPKTASMKLIHTITAAAIIKDPAKLQPLIAAYKPDGKSATSEMPHWRTDPARADWRARNTTPVPTRYLSP